MTAEQFIKVYIQSEFLMPKQLKSKPKNIYVTLMQNSPKWKEALQHD